MANQTSDSTLLNPIESDQSSSSLEIKKILAKDPTSFDDNIYLGNTSKQLEAIKKLLENVPEVNEARVLYFKAEIELGNYTIDSNKIAKKMLNIEPV
jgi:negative regulator of flagellin synthesis FlgM